MNYEGKYYSVSACHSIKDEDGLDGEMPCSCPIGCGYDDRNAAHDETDYGGCET